MSDEHDIDGVCLIERLQRPRKVIDGELPDGTPIKWRLLSATERLQAKAKAREKMRSVGIDPDALFNANELEIELGWQIAAIAMRDPRVKGHGQHVYPVPATFTEDPKTHVKEPDADKLRDVITIQEFPLLLDQYLDFEDLENPQAERLTDREMAEINAALKKKDRTALRDFGADTLALYLLTTDNRQSTSLTGKSPSGTDSATTQ